MYKKDRVLEGDLRLKLSGSGGTMIALFLKTTGYSIQEYYDKTGSMNINVGFMLEGKEANELPEVLIGETKVLGLELVPTSDIDSFFMDLQDTRLVKLTTFNPGPGKDNRERMKELMNEKDPNTVKFGEEYETFTFKLLEDIKQKNINIDEVEQLPKKIKDSRCSKRCSESVNKKLFMYARYFYYENCFNKEFSLQTQFISTKGRSIQYIAALPEGHASEPKYIAKGTCFANERIFNFYQCTNGSVQTYRFGFSIQNALDISKTPMNFTKALVERIYSFTNTGIFSMGSKPSIICISLLTPCNTTACKAVQVGSKAMPKEAYFSFQESNIIALENKAFAELDSNNIFINLPLGSSKGGFLYNTGIESINPNSAYEFQKLIDKWYQEGSRSVTTFKTLVEIALLYYFKYKHYALCYHCKSGKDRTSICDAVVQATIYYVETEKYTYDEWEGVESMQRDDNIYEQIRQYAVYFLLYGFIITFYSTCIIGIKLDNIPVAEYILGDRKSYLYTFFKGNSRMSTS